MYELVKETKMNQDYNGHAESCIYEFTVALPDQLGSRWSAEMSLNSHISALRDAGSILLEYRLWEDKAPLFETQYRCQIVASASPLFWNVIIIGAIVIIGLFLISWTIKSVSDIARYAPGSIKTLAISGAVIAVAVVAVVLLKRG
jgi:hypothetical protein